jgi:Fe-S-cluster containining protein
VYLDEPKNKVDFDEIRWFVAHENVSVYRDHDKQWIVEFKTPCNYQNPDNTCATYETRPNVCARYEPKICTFNTEGKIYDKVMLKTPEDLDAYLAKRKKKKDKKKRKAKN